jgi:hypothetical protein
MFGKASLSVDDHEIASDEVATGTFFPFEDVA